MQVSYNWLKQYVPFNLKVEDVAEILTNTGLEVEEFEAWESIKGGLKNVLIGEIVECAKHPDADKLQITKVNVGAGELLQIVCGAPNARVGVKSPVALVGAQLYPVNATEPFVIKKSKIRGVESFGMICAEDELGLGESHNGIMELPGDVKVGTPAAEYFKVERDYVITIGLTPNRSDAFSHIGTARDLRAALDAVYNVDLPLELPSEVAKGIFANPINIEIANTEKCKRYTGLYIKNVQVKPSPQWLQNRLKAIGAKPINNIVDITNFVLHEFGQPLHAFDADKITGGKIVVKTVAENTKFITLDNTERKLSEEDLMICDSEKPLCIAGVYGGVGSGVTTETKNVFLESAFFDAISIRKTAQRHGLRTDASQHYEKTTDINVTLKAAHRAALLIAELAGGEISETTDVYPSVQANAEVETSYARINELAGTNLPKEKVNKILSDLGVEVSATGDELKLSVPTYKTEVTREADIVEEILRIYGYNTIPMPKHLKSSLSFSNKIDNLKWENIAANYLVGAGYFEASTNSITQSKFETDKVLQEQTVRLLNSQTSELDALRTSMVYSLLEVVQRNSNFKNADLKLFEFGKTYIKKSANTFTESATYEQIPHLAVVLSGKTVETNWLEKGEKVNFYHLKTDILNVLKRIAGNFTTSAFENEGVFAFGIKLFAEEQLIGTIGKISNPILKSFDIKQDVFYANILWDEVLNRTQFNKIQFNELPKYPAVQRDLSMVVETNLPFRKIEEIAFAENKNKLLREVSLFDVYKGEKIEAGKKSYAVSFTFQDESKTLTEKDIDKAMGRLMEKLEKDAGAVIRKG